MIINKEILAAHGVCGSGYRKFVELFGEGEPQYWDCVAVVEELERVDPAGTKMWGDFVRMLKASEKFYAMQPDSYKPQG